MKTSIHSYALSLGFDRIGFANADRLIQDGHRYEAWLAEGFAASMEYLKREPSLRYDPQQLLPGAKSVIVVAANYASGERTDEPQAQIARYAHGKDYHLVLRKRLESLVRYLEMLAPDAVSRTFVDTGPLLERAYAQKAGIGFVGKNTCVISKGVGSFVFLGSVVTTLALEADEPDTRSCGTCRLCLDACPTGALPEPFKLDARRCISFLTIENREAIPTDLRPRVGSWLFGCDVCQDVCPHNARLPETQIPDWVRPSQDSGHELDKILSLHSDDDFETFVAGRPIRRAKREGLVRNACVVAANLGRRDLIPVLEALAQNDASDLVREHAAWALKVLKV